MRPWIILLGIAACGDDLRRDSIVPATSGSRLKLERYFYDDGSRQVAPDAFFDPVLHARCTPAMWSDGALRCAPVADEAIYTDAACTLLVGRADVIAKPTLFVGYDQVAGTRLPARIYYAGTAQATPVSERYDRIDGECKGPFFTPSATPYFELDGEVDAVALHDSERGTETDRLALEIRATDDGLYVPLGLRDRVLDVRCNADDRPDGTVCEPVSAATTQNFLDPACEQPAIAVLTTSPPPSLVRSDDPGGCAQYYRLGAKAAGPLYARSGTACVAFAPSPIVQPYALGEELELPALERIVEDEPGRRLQRIGIRGDAGQLFDDRMFDTATRQDCQPYPFDDQVRCLPTGSIPARTLFAPGCTLSIRVAEVPDRTCSRVAFATSASDDGQLQLHVIGDRITTALYAVGPGGCAPYVPPVGTAVRSLGPPIPIETFVAGRTAGER